MADPARYDIDPMLRADSSSEMFYAELHVERSVFGRWIKWADFVDYKAAQRRNKSEETVISLGKEVVELRSHVADLEEQLKNIRQATLMLMADKDKTRNGKQS